MTIQAESHSISIYAYVIVISFQPGSKYNCALVQLTAVPRLACVFILLCSYALACQYKP